MVERNEPEVSEHAASAAFIDKKLFPLAKRFFIDTTNLYLFTQTFRRNAFSCSLAETRELEKVLQAQRPRRIMYLICSSKKGFIHAHGVIKFKQKKHRSSQKAESHREYGFLDCRPCKDWDALRIWLRYILNDPGNIHVWGPSLGESPCTKCSTFHGDIAKLNFFQNLRKFFSGINYIPTCHETIDVIDDTVGVPVATAGSPTDDTHCKQGSDSEASPPENSPLLFSLPLPNDILSRLAPHLLL
mgnify:FL=1